VTEQERLAAALAYQGATAAPPTMAQQLAKVPSRLVGALKALGTGSSYGSAEPVNAVNDLARANFWRGSVFGVPEDVKQRNIDRAAEIAATFIGPKAKSWNSETNARALQMEQAGATPQAIWQETGNWKAPDSAWRQEINDAGSRMTEKVHSDIMSKHFYNDPLSEALTHESLYRAYPELGRIKTTVTAMEQPKGSFSPLRNELEASGPSSLTQRSTALHEIQHAIQQKEGFARGGNPEMFRQSIDFSSKALQDAAILDKTMRASNLSQLEALKRFEVLFGRKPEAGAFAALERVGTGKELDIARDAAREAEKLAKNPLESYRRLAGEAEARATQKRRNLTDEQRRAEFPERSYDVPINELIIRR
jgi:hypothetical protein